MVKVVDVSIWEGQPIRGFDVQGVRIDDDRCFDKTLLDSVADVHMFAGRLVAVGTRQRIYETGGHGLREGLSGHRLCINDGVDGVRLRYVLWFPSEQMETRSVED